MFFGNFDKSRFCYLWKKTGKNLIYGAKFKNYEFFCGIIMYFYDKLLTFVLTNRFSVAIIYAELRRKAVIEK